MAARSARLDTLTLPLFLPPDKESFGPDAWLLRAYARRDMWALWDALREVVHHAPLRQMKTPGGAGLGVATTNCGSCGWVTDHRGYRYTRKDPMTERLWPQMPPVFRNVAISAAQKAGFDAYSPDVAVINRYAVGTKMGLHQDRDERDLRAPVVSISLGLSAIFLLGGKSRDDPTQRIILADSDVFVWGGQSRLNYHGVLPVAPGHHVRTGSYRFNITLRKAQ